MTPISAIFNVRNGRVANAIFYGYFFVFAIICKYCACLMLCEPRPWAKITAPKSAMRDSIGIIVFLRTPSKIVGLIVPRITVIVQTYLPVCWWANKSPQNKLVRGKHLSLAVFPKLDEWSACFSAARLLQRSNFFDVAKARDFVKSLKPNNWQPRLYKSIFHASIVADKGFAI